MVTKKDLESKFDLSANTVYKTLQCCGLDTSNKQYSDEEIEQYFVPARKMLDAGKTYSDVESYFGTKSSQGTEEVEQSEFNASGFAANEADDAVDGVTMATAQAFSGMVDQAVKEVAPFIPALVAQAINQEMQQGGEIRKAFDNFNEQVRGGKRMSSGAQFLVQKLRQSKKNQLTGTAQEQHLLEASAENLDENSNESSES